MISLLATLAAAALIGGLLAAFGRSQKNTGKQEQVNREEQVKNDHIKQAMEVRDNVVRMRDGSDARGMLDTWARGDK